MRHMNTSAPTVSAPQASGHLEIVSLQGSGGMGLAALNADLNANGGDLAVHATAEGLVLPGPQPRLLADSPLRIIYCYDFDPASGKISNRRVFARTPQGAHPDGATVDAQGYLWSAHWGAGTVVRYAPDGEVDRVLAVPASQPTCVAFGGTELDLLFVTSARDGLSAQALAAQSGAGDVFVYKMDVKGLPDRRYA